MNAEILKLIAFIFATGSSIRESILLTYNLIEKNKSLIDFQADFLKVNNIRFFKTLISYQCKQRFDGEIVHALIKKNTRETEFKNVEIDFNGLRFFNMLSSYDDNNILMALQTF